MKGTFDGRHMSAILVTGFAVVVAVNIGAAVVAKRTFGGVVVENSYVASQDFNGWLDEAGRERSLGWQVEPSRQPDGRVRLTLRGVPDGARIEAVARHPLGRLPDRPIHFSVADDGVAVSYDALPAGRWTLRTTVQGNGQQFRSESALR